MNDYVALGIIAGIFPALVLFIAIFRSKKEAEKFIKGKDDFIVEIGPPIEHVFYLPCLDGLVVLKQGDNKMKDFHRLFVYLGEL